MGKTWIRGPKEDILGLQQSPSKSPLIEPSGVATLVAPVFNGMRDFVRQQLKDHEQDTSQAKQILRAMDNGVADMMVKLNDAAPLGLAMTAPTDSHLRTPTRTRPPKLYGKSCEGCLQKRRSCDAVEPVCGRCRISDTECIYRPLPEGCICERCEEYGLQCDERLPRCSNCATAGKPCGYTGRLKEDSPHVVSKQGK